MWYERFPGHYYLSMEDSMGYTVHVCARGTNQFNPIAIITHPGKGDIFWKRCSSLTEAQNIAFEAYHVLMIKAAEHLLEKRQLCQGTTDESPDLVDAHIVLCGESHPGYQEALARVKARQKPAAELPLKLWAVEQDYGLYIVAAATGEDAIELVVISKLCLEDYFPKEELPKAMEKLGITEEQFSYYRNQLKATEIVPTKSEIMYSYAE